MFDPVPLILVKDIMAYMPQIKYMANNDPAAKRQRTHWRNQFWLLIEEKLTLYNIVRQKVTTSSTEIFVWSKKRNYSEPYMQEEPFRSIKLFLDIHA